MCGVLCVNISLFYAVLSLYVVDKKYIVCDNKAMQTIDSHKIKGIIYKATSPVSGKSYIGQTINTLSQRIQRHKRSNGCRALYNAIQKYGDTMQWDVVHTVYGDTKEQVIDTLNALETHYIEYFETVSPVGYNLHSGGASHTPSAETRQRMVENHARAWKGKKHTEEVKRKLSLANKGKKHTEETKRKLSIANTGKKHTEESKKKMTAALKKRWKDPACRKKMSLAKKGENNPNYGKKLTGESKKKISVAKKKYFAENPSHSQKKTKATNISTGEVFIFESATKAAERLSAVFDKRFDGGNISNVCNPKRYNKTHNGFTFEYITA